MYPPSISSSFTSNISAYAPFPSDSSQGTLFTMENLPGFAWEDSAKTYLNSFNQLWPQYISSNDVRHIESCDPVDVVLNNICQLCCAIQVSRKRIKNLMLERNTLIESGRASKRRITELKESLTEEKARVAQLKENYENLKTDYDNLRAQS